MNRIQEERLRKLAEHLNSDNLFQTKWDFSRLHEVIGECKDEFSIERQNNPCGTVGCALGEVPFLFKEDGMSYNELGEIIWKDCLYKNSTELAVDFFGVPYVIAELLFVPWDDIPNYPEIIARRYNLNVSDCMTFSNIPKHIEDIAKRFGLDILNSKASKLDVAYNINALLDYYRRNNLIKEN